MQIKATAGSTAEGAFPNAAIPAGRDSTPAPTIDLTRLKISLGMVAVPVPAVEALLSAAASSSSAMRNGANGAFLAVESEMMEDDTADEEDRTAVTGRRRADG
mmetsp:Transcript_1559/g.2653  ORF Transcript_1559/g.2653 Transcript_1559/m.2653 type:complete len:103 (+) Transcript_1559:1313-1621(+)